MLSYRHGFHAGGFADVHKHVALTMLLLALQRKPTPLCFVDSHAGAGSYDLGSDFAVKNREFETGITRLWSCKNAPAAVTAYLELIGKVNRVRTGAGQGPRIYPGSPRIARLLLRPGDRMVLMELHNSEYPQLKREFKHDRQVTVHHRDAYEALPGLLPPAERRGLVLLDPAYELRDEFIRLTETFSAAWRKWPTGVYLIWYPLQRRQPVPQFLRALKRTGIRRILLNELTVAPDDAPNRLSGSGLVIVNPPWQFDKEMNEAAQWLAPLLDRGAGVPPRTHWLVPE